MLRLFNKQAILAPAGIQVRYLSLIVSVALKDLKACFPQAAQAKLLRAQVIRERDATVSLTAGMEKFRPGSQTAVGGFFVAGDWTDTGLPATIESAVVSGLKCADLLT